MTAVFYDIYLFSISTLFKILEWAASSYVGSVQKKTCQKLATVDKGLIGLRGEAPQPQKNLLLGSIYISWNFLTLSSTISRANKLESTGEVLCGTRNVIHNLAPSTNSSHDVIKDFVVINQLMPVVCGRQT